METQTRQLALDSSQNESCGFLTIARELRDMIYGHLLEICPADHCHPDGTAKSYTLPSLAILATNKQIRDEAQAVYGKVNQVVKIETDVDLASMEEPRAIGFLNTKTGQTANDSLRRFNRLAELLGEANLPALKISSASTVKAERGNKAGSLLVMLEDLPDLMLGLYLHQALDGGVVREKASIARLTLKWELPRSTKAQAGTGAGGLTDCLWQCSPPVGLHDFDAFGSESSIVLQRSASVPMFRRPAWPLAEVHNLDGEASVLYWDERDIDSAIAVWRHAMSYLDIYAFELVHCSLALDDEDFAEYAELRFNIGLQIAGALFSRMSTTENTVTSERDLEKKHNLRCNLGLAHLDRASSMLCTGLFEPSAEARLWFLYAKMSSMIWPANLWQAEGAIEQACALDPGMPHYEKEHNDIYVISYATETGNLGAVHEQEEDRANPQWTVFQHPDPDSPRVVYTAYRHLPENIAVALREKIANGQSDGVL